MYFPLEVYYTALTDNINLIYAGRGVGFSPSWLICICYSDNIDEHYVQGQKTSVDSFHAMLGTAENLQAVNHQHPMHQDNQPMSKA